MSEGQRGGSNEKHEQGTNKKQLLDDIHTELATMSLYQMLLK